MQGDPFHYTLHLACACGHAVTFDARDVPASFHADRFMNIPPEVWHRFRCSQCGRKGRPQDTIRGTVAG